MNDPAPQDTGEFLAVDTPNGEMAAELDALRKREADLVIALSNRQTRLHEVTHVPHLVPVGTSWLNCCVHTCREARHVLGIT